MLVGRKLFDVVDMSKLLGVDRSMIFRYVEAGRLRPLLRNKKRKGDPLYFSHKELKRFKEEERPKIKKGRPFTKSMVKEVI